MTESVDLSPPRFAALAAPAVTRMVVAGHRAAGTEGRELVASCGGPPAGDAEGVVTPTDRGHAFLRDLFALHGKALARRWGDDSDQTGLVGNAALVDRLLTVVTRVMARAEATAGEAWAVQAPPHEPAGAPAALRLFNLLATLRYHRADAHAAGWRAAGLTATEVAALPWGATWTPQRDQAERETNERDAAPYTVLTAEERLGLLADLAALP